MIQNKNKAQLTTIPAGPLFRPESVAGSVADFIPCPDFETERGDETANI